MIFSNDFNNTCQLQQENVTKRKKIDCFSINKSSAAHLPELNIDNLKLFTFVHTKKIGTSVS